MTLSQLHQEYVAHRMVQLSEPEFASMISFAPVLMVAVSDHNVDHLEMGYLTGLLAEQTLSVHDPLASGQGRQLMLQTFVDELKFLLYHMEPWEEKILGVLSAELAHKPAVKDKLRVQMVAMAMASRGMNELEFQKIHQICERLDIAL